ncbi:zinc finger protein 429 [Eurytemora carolleeae]|uniref:zinc finger protein 429 n=1 Tax=Eurytemora carolleeae TaxID=1294199 RepID=UPI000C7926BB|nr:zinc finger protein 429 [Eurytemora carolleeae]|eukprot:XP_023330424.1 zinc finger protein 429-like [Eurytemora affinis]
MKDYKLELEYSGRSCTDARGNHVTKICEYCLLEFSSQHPASHSDIRFHLSSHHNTLEDQVYSCKCGRTFSKKGSRNFHYKRCESSSIAEQQNITCEYCGKLLKNLNRLNLHMKHCKRDVMCELCSKLFSTGRKLEEHMYAVHGDTTCSVQGKREYPCDECDKVFRKKYNLESHKLMHSDFKQFLCDVEGCGRRFKRHVTLRQHIDSVHNKLYSTVYCNFCTAQFKSRSGLRLHIAAVHAIGEAGSRKYKCDECDKMFKCSADLKVHTVSHTKEKAYSCDMCGQKFARNNSLTEHMNIHSRKFPCAYCEKCFGRERYLKGHESTCSLNPLLNKDKVDVEDIYSSNHEHTTVIITKNEGKDVCTPLQIVHATPSGVLTLPSVTLTLLKDPGRD